MHSCDHGSADIDGAFSIGQKEKILVFCILFRPHRLSVRTLGSHPKKRGPTPLGATRKKRPSTMFCRGVE